VPLEPGKPQSLMVECGSAHFAGDAVEQRTDRRGEVKLIGLNVALLVLAAVEIWLATGWLGH
jgi:hypothetical protein